MVLGHVHNPKVVIMNYEEKMKKLLKIIFLFFLVAYGCFILNVINVWIFMYVFNAWQNFDVYYKEFIVYTACSIVVVTMYLLHKKKS